MERGFGIDHVVIVVADLAAAIEDYRALGFTVTPGGRHERFGSHNALIPFEDDAYLELIAFKEGRALGDSPAERRVGKWALSQEGLVDFALLPASMEEAISAARERGLALAGPQQGARQRPDGQRVAWQFAFPGGVDVPFLCSDVTARELRVPAGRARVHSNGATGILSITVAIQDLSVTLPRYRALLGIREAHSLSSAPPESRIAIFSLEGVGLVLASPTGQESPIREQLDSRGEGPYSLALYS
ncbi:MAG: VOC family protein, partial [Ardenticatenaceae bacterium]